MDRTISFTNNSTVTSDRILYTPSSFARSSLLTLQEIGTLHALKPHTSSRDNLQSYLFFYVSSGGGKLVYGGAEYDIGEGDCIFIDCQQPYSHSTDKNLWTLSWVHFYGPAMKGIYNKYKERGGRPVFRPDSLAPFQSLHHALFSIASSDDYIRDMRINGELNNLLTLLMEYSWQREIRASVSKKMEISRVKAYLDENYKEKISLESVAEHFFVDKHYLARLFKGRYGVTLVTYLHQARITHAKQMLRFTDKTIEEIGLECGIGELNYFSRLFRKMEGISPSEFRRLW